MPSLNTRPFYKQWGKKNLYRLVSRNIDKWHIFLQQLWVDGTEQKYSLGQQICIVSKYYSFSYKRFLYRWLMSQTRHGLFPNQTSVFAQPWHKRNLRILCELKEKYFCPLNKSIEKGGKKGILLLGFVVWWPPLPWLDSPPEVSLCCRSRLLGC